MKTISIFRTLVAAASLAVGCFSFPAHAQMDDQALLVNVPFGFELGSRHLAPGTYTVSRPMIDVIEIRNGSDAAMIVIHDGQSTKATKNSKVVFDRYGD